MTAEEELRLVRHQLDMLATQRAHWDVTDAERYAALAEREVQLLNGDRLG